MKKNHLFTIAAFCIIFQSCDKKKNISPDPPLATYNSVDEVFESLRLKPKTLTIDASVTNSFYGNSGTRYTIYANSLAGSDGTAVTGQVQVEVNEWLERGDMVFSKMLPVSNGEPLVSGGQLDIKVTQNGQPLHLKDNYQFRAYVPQKGTPDPDMQLYWGKPADNPTQNLTNWNLAPRDSNNIETGMILVHNGDTLSLFSDSLTMCNIDRVLKTPPIWQDVNINSVVQGASFDANTQVCTYALYKDINTVVPIGMYNKSNFSSRLPEVPVHLAAFTVIGGKFYGGMVEITPVTGKTYTITLAHTDPVAFKQLVNGL